MIFKKNNETPTFDRELAAVFECVNKSMKLHQSRVEIIWQHCRAFGVLIT
jgi:hypothetical protein